MAMRLPTVEHSFRCTGSKPSHSTRSSCFLRSCPVFPSLPLAAPLLHGRKASPCMLPRQRHVAIKAQEEEPDWNKEMSIFQKRISRPNQLATLRELERHVNVGKVLFVRSNLAIISGLNADAPVGTKLSFITGGTGVLLWHRSNNLVFAIILGGASTITVGEAVECKIKGVLQVVDEVKGPTTRKDYEMALSPAGDALFGKVINFFGFERGMDYEHANAAVLGQAPVGFDKVRPLVNQQIDMKGREQITESLLTGVKGLDILTPLGRGMNFSCWGLGALANPAWHLMPSLHKSRQTSSASMHAPVRVTRKSAQCGRCSRRAKS